MDSALARRSVRGMSLQEDVAVYDHSRWTGYLLQRLLPGCTRIVSGRADTVENILSCLDPGCSFFIFHIDLTSARERPLARADLCAELSLRGVRVLNAGVEDISKRSLQRKCAEIGLPTTAAQRVGPPEEMLIVKTNLNYGGIPERVAGYATAPGPTAEPMEYPVVSRRGLDPDTWDRPDLVVERFISDEQDRLFRCAVLGHRRAWFRFISAERVKRVPSDTSLMVAEETVPDAARLAVNAFISSHGCDFGAFDVLVSDEHAYIIDFNSTPVWGDGDLGPLVLLSDGLRSSKR
ncbi:hypothetical protein ACWEQG_33545 [Microbispora sp. NPDC004025]